MSILRLQSDAMVSGSVCCDVAFVAVAGVRRFSVSRRYRNTQGFRTNQSLAAFCCVAPKQITFRLGSEEIASHFKPAHGLNAARFARFLAADWHNPEQSKHNSQGWAHIHVAFRPLPNAFLGGYAFYAESAYDYNLGLPYKTSVVLVVHAPGAVAKPDTLELASFKIRDPDEFWLGAHEPELLDGLSRNMLLPLTDKCNSVFSWIDDEQKYIGTSRPGKQCTIQRRDTEPVTYLDSRIILSRDSYSPWDIGRDVDTDEFIWGGTQGPFEMIANKRFDHLVSDNFLVPAESS
jgi:CpeT protein